jgi:hypothetical protein
VSSIGRITRFVESLPFAFEDSHHASVERRSIARAERHDAKTILFVVGGEEGELFLIAFSNLDLVITGLVVEGNKIETAGRVAEVVNSIVATRDRILERESDLVETAI